MAYSTLGGGAAGGPTLYMTIAARDRTREAFDRVKTNMNKLQSVVLRTMSSVGTLSMSFATLGRITGMLNDNQARAIGIFGMVMNIMVTVATVVKALTAIEWGHVAALTWKVSLMTLGVGVAIAAAAAIAVLATQTQNATDQQRKYNLEIERGISTERRRTSNRNLVRRGEIEEVI